MQENREVFLSPHALPPSQDQYDQIEKHTQSGIDLLELYVKFVKERTEIEQSYAKQLRCVYMLLCFPSTPQCQAPSTINPTILLFDGRNLTKKYAKRGSKDELDCK